MYPKTWFPGLWALQIPATAIYGGMTMIAHNPASPGLVTL